MTRVVEIKKSALAQFRGLGLSVAEIANKYGISEKDAKQILVQAGFVKTRGSKEVEAPAYVITYVNDIAEVEATESVDIVA